MASFTIQRPGNNDNPILVYQSEVFPKATGCTWKYFRLASSSIGPDLSVRLTLSITDLREGKPQKMIGQIEAVLSDLLGRVGESIPLSDPNRRKRNGFVKFVRLRVGPKARFHDHLRDGLTLNFVVGIDFSLSNELISAQNSLHRLSDTVQNRYETSLDAIGSVILPYSKEELIEVIGFGGELAGGGRHPDGVILFDGGEAGADGATPVRGLAPALSLYRTAVGGITFLKDKNVAPVIALAGRRAASSWARNMMYTVLLVLTTGRVADFAAVVSEVIDASNAPLSIIVVDVGHNKGDDKLAVLDGNGVPFEEGSRRAARDILTFVKFNKTLPDKEFGLAAEALKHIPTHVEQYCVLNGIEPRS
jgi:hypothetical protein